MIPIIIINENKSAKIIINESINIYNYYIKKYFNIWKNDFYYNKYTKHYKYFYITFQWLKKDSLIIEKIFKNNYSVLVYKFIITDIGHMSLNESYAVYNNQLDIDKFIKYINSNSFLNVLQCDKKIIYRNLYNFYNFYLYKTL